ncbi:MAG: PAS domain-containing sensor histidine kinase [Desulfuromonadales bacterium]
MSNSALSYSHEPLSIAHFFQLACEQHSAPILIIGLPDGEILHSNREAAKLYGYCQTALHAMKLSDIISSSPPEFSAQPAAPEGCITSLHRIGDGSLRTVTMYASRLSLSDGEILFCILHDISGHVQIERTNEHLEKIREQLEIIVDERTRQLNETLEHLRLEELARRLIESNVTTIREKLEDQERARVARDIHDGIGQSLQAVKLQLKMRQALCKQGEACGGYALNEAIREITSASTELREIILALHPLFLVETNLDVAVRAMCERTAKRTNLIVRAECHGAYRDISSPIKLSIFRICQEALSNIIKHARSGSATVLLERESRALRVVIRDDGIGGVSCPSVIHQEGSGLTIMRERVELLNGSFSIVSPPGLGTVITLMVPLP